MLGNFSAAILYISYFRFYKLRKILNITLSKSMLILTNQYKIPFYKSSKEIPNYFELSNDLINNSSLIYKIAYLFNSLLIILLNSFPKSISKFFFRTVISPKFNPLSKAFLFYIYHHGF